MQGSFRYCFRFTMSIRETFISGKTRIWYTSPENVSCNVLSYAHSSYKSSSLCLTFFTIEEPTVACLSTLTSFSIPRILSQISAWRCGQSFPMHTLTLLKNSFSGIVFKTAIHQRCQDNLSTKCHWKWEVSCILTIFSLFDTHRKRDTPVLPAQA